MKYICLHKTTYCCRIQSYTRQVQAHVSVVMNLWVPWNRGDLFTYSTVQSPSSEANWFAASQEIPRISRNPKVHCRTRERPPPVSILGQPNPVHIPTSHLLEIHPNFTPMSPQLYPSLRFPQQHPVRLAALLVRHSNPRSSKYKIGLPATSLHNWVRFVKNSRLQVVLRLFNDGAAPNNL